MRTTKSARPGSVVYVPMDKSEFRSIIFSEKKKNKIKKIVILIILMIFVIGCCIYAGKGKNAGPAGHYRKRY